MKLLNRVLRAAWDPVPYQTKLRIFRAAWRDTPYQTKLMEGMINDLAVLLNLRSLGFTPDYVFDIGAYHGLWTKKVKEIFTSAHFLLFEAQEEQKEIIKSTLAETVGWQLFHDILGDRNEWRDDFDV